jgi:hypothetical protein
MKSIKSKFKLILITAILCIASSFAFGQTDLNKTFIGYWTQSSSGSTVRCIIFKDKDDIHQMVLWDSSDGEELQVLKIQVETNTIKTTQKMISTNWVTYNTYSIVDANTLKCSIGGDGDGVLIYFKRLK